MTEDLINTLLHQSEGETLDFKREQYRFYGAGNADKAELLKDILAFANAWKNTNAYILIGVDEVRGAKANVVRVNDHLNDNDIQQFVNGKTNRQVRFLCGTIQVGGQLVDYVRINQSQDRPIFLLKDFGGLSANAVFIRHGSSTEVANPQEICDMGVQAAAGGVDVPSLDIEFADPKSRKCFGQEVTVTSVRLVDPRPRPMTAADREVLRNIMPSLKIAESVRAIHVPSLLRERPSAADVRTFHEKTSLLTSFGLCVQNPGIVTANDIQLEITIPQVPGATVIDDSDYPVQPRGPYEMAFSQRIQSAICQPELSINLHDGCWVASMRIPKLQPKATHWTGACLHIGADHPAVVEMNARLFADSLPEPLCIPMRVNIHVEERVYEKADFKVQHE